MKLSTQVGIGPGHIVLDEDPAPYGKGHSCSHFRNLRAHVYCGQTAGWIKMPFGTEVGLDPGHIVLDEDPSPPPQRGIAPNFRSMSIVAKRSPISAIAEH